MNRRGFLMGSVAAVLAPLVPAAIAPKVARLGYVQETLGVTVNSRPWTKDAAKRFAYGLAYGGKRKVGVLGAFDMIDDSDDRWQDVADQANRDGWSWVGEDFRPLHEVLRVETSRDESRLVPPRKLGEC